MIFQRTWKQVLTGEKTQTRRLYKSPFVYEIGKTYAVQPGRGKSTLWWKILDGVLCVNPAIEWKPTDTLDGYDYEDMRRFDNRATWRKHGYAEGRIQITDRRREDVRHISDADVIAEGFNNRGAFFDVWLAMHDTSAAKIYSSHAITPDARNYLWTRPAERYQAWVLTFCLVTGDAS